MNQYNDYVSTIVRYLKTYNNLTVWLENMRAEKVGKEQVLLAIDAPIASYSLTAGCGGGDGGSRVEGDVEKRIVIEEKVKELDINIREVETTISKVDRALDGLDDESKQVVSMRFVDKRKWQYIAMTMHCSEKSCRNISEKALEQLSVMVFGPRALPEEGGQLSFVFYK